MREISNLSLQILKIIIVVSIIFCAFSVPVVAENVSAQDSSTINTLSDELEELGDDYLGDPKEHYDLLDLVNDGASAVKKIYQSLGSQILWFDKVIVETAADIILDEGMRDGFKSEVNGAYQELADTIGVRDAYDEQNEKEKFFGRGTKAVMDLISWTGLGSGTIVENVLKSAVEDAAIGKTAELAVDATESIKSKINDIIDAIDDTNDDNFESINDNDEKYIPNLVGTWNALNPGEGMNSITMVFNKDGTGTIYITSDSVLMDLLLDYGNNYLNHGDFIWDFSIQDESYYIEYDGVKHQIVFDGDNYFILDEVTFVKQ